MRMLDELSVRREGIVKTLEDQVRKAEDENRDLTDEEVSTRTAAKADIEAIDRRMASLAEDFAVNSDLARRVNQLSKATPSDDFQYRDAGLALWDMLHQDDGKARERWQLSMRAAEHMGTSAAVTEATAGDLGGLTIAPSVGAIVDPYPKGMPFLSAFGLNRIPAADFSRPYLNDPDFETGAGKQAKQKAELVSKKFDVKSQSLSPETYGSYLNISQQLLILQAGSLGIIVEHLRRRLAWQLETAAITELAKTTGKQVLAATASAADTQKAIYDAVGTYMTATKDADVMLVMGPKGFAQIGALSDLAGRPAFPTLGAVNAGATSTAKGFTSTLFGIPVTVTWAIKDTVMYLVGGSSFEAWYYPLPMLSVVEPSVLGRQVSVSAMLAPYRPVPNSNAAIAFKTA